MRVRKKSICPNCNTLMTIDDYKEGSLCCIKCHYRIQALGPTDFFFLYSYDKEKHKWIREGSYFDDDTDYSEMLSALPCPRVWLSWDVYDGLKVYRFDYSKNFGLDNPTFKLIDQNFYTQDMQTECIRFVQEFAAGLVNPDDWDRPNFYKE